VVINNIIKGNSFVVCIHFAKSDGTGQRGVFPLVVDKYSALQLSGAYSLMDPSSKTTNTTITIQVQNSNITK
jgi:hypothetical protein